MKEARLTCRLALLLVCFTTILPAQNHDGDPSEILRRPGWNYGGQIFGGFTVVQVTNPLFLTANRDITNLAVAFHAARVLNHEHGPSFVRGTFECDFNVIPVEIFWVRGARYAGGFEPVGIRWNFTSRHGKAVPFAGAAFGLLFSPENFPPGNTYQMNFTAAIDAGAHIFVRRHQSIDVTGRVFHLSNAYLGPYNPGIPVGLQFGVGYSWF